MNDNVYLRPAETEESTLLTEISLASKMYWPYPDEYMQIWKDELTITPQYIEENEVYICSVEDSIAGYYSLVELDSSRQVDDITLAPGLWLDHMFIKPDLIGKGIGREMFSHCILTCLKKHHSLIRLLADPHSGMFYIKMGCRYIEEYPSTVPGRTTPYFEYLLDG